MVEYGILGPLTARTGGVLLDLGGPRTRAVLGVLLLNRNTVVSVDRLIDLVWGDDAPPTAETALQGHVARLRRVLGPELIETQTPGYSLRVGTGEVDVERFETLIRKAGVEQPRDAAGLLREALGLWRGEPLANFAHEAFAAAEIARLGDMRMGAIEARIEADLATGRHEAVTNELDALCAEHPYHEHLHALRMLALYRSGRQVDALAAFRSVRALLDENLGIDPGPELQALEARILQQDPTLAAPAGPATAVVGSTAPDTDLDPLIGRTDELADVEAALAAARLVTITGLGGTGKTRLAQEVVRRSSAAGDVAYFVDLGPYADASEVPGAVADAIGLGGSGRSDLAEAIGQELARAPSLLILDNLEHLLDSRLFIRALLERARPLRILGTSRIHLGIKGEHEIPLDPLSVATSVEELEQAGAGLLFLRRAREAGRLASLDRDDAIAVVEICRRLDGLPLSVELAAAWTRVLSPRAIARRLTGDRLTLAGADGTRHASLAAVLEATLGLLEARDRTVFGSLGVFAGGFDEAAAIAVTGMTDVLAMLRHLEEVSLIRMTVQPDGEPRFGLLETIRSVAALQLGKLEDEALVRRRHAEHYATQADVATDHWRTAGDGVGSDWQTLEMPNLREALSYAMRTMDGSLAARLAAVTGLHLMRSGRAGEGRLQVQEALALGGAPPAIRSEALTSLAWLLSELEGMTDLRRITEEAVDQARAGGQSRALARALIAHAGISQPSNAEAVFREAVDIALSLGFTYQAEVAYNNLAEFEASRGRLNEALTWYELAHRSSADRGDKHKGGTFLGSVAEVQLGLGDFGSAIDAGRQAVDALRAGGMPYETSSALAVLATAEEAAGLHDDAVAHLEEAADRLEGSDAAKWLVAVLIAAVEIVPSTDPALAARALGAVDRWAERSPLTPMYQERLAAATSVLAANIGDAGLAHERGVGHETDPAALLNELRAVLTHDRPS